jgi:two-component system OmpR family sensor kinase
MFSVRSIRWRFLLWLAFLLVCVLGALGVTAFQFHRAQEFARIDGELTRDVAALSGALRQPLPAPNAPRREPAPGAPAKPLDDRPIHLTPEIEDAFDAAKSDRGLYFTIWSPAGTVRRQGGTLPDALPVPVRVGADTTMHVRSRDVLREAWHFTERGNCVLVGRSIAADLAALRRFAWLLAGAGAAVLAFALGGGAWLVSRALKPVDAIGATATRIASGNLAERINVAGTDSELGQLARVLNETFARLEAAFARQQQFTADAAHELRTPLSVLISEAQITLARERSPEEYRHALQVCLDTAQQMRRLAESLLELARFDAGREPLKREPFDLATVARDCAALVRPLAEARGIRLYCEAAAVPCLGDAVRVSQVVTNLLSNSIEYNRAHGEVRVTVHPHQRTAVLTVADTGEGITPENLPHIFERFHRADSARSGNGHAGLGLAICKTIVDAHGGNIEVTSRPGEGTCFTVRLPAA